jgi:hypothetical protein
MNEEGITKALEIVESMKEAARNMEYALEKKNSDSIMEIKKEIMDLQKRLLAFT